MFTTAAGCGSDGPTAAPAGRTLVVPGTGAPVSCSQVPYDYALEEKDPAGTGVVVDRGHIRGAVWVACAGIPSSFTIKVVLLRNGLPYGSERTFTGLPNAVGYAASVFETCTAGVYRVRYSYRWTALGGVQADTTTTPLSETVTAHDCDS